MSKILFPLMILLSFYDHAFALSARSVVKIESRPCEQNAPVFRGSGVAFSYADNAYVITSEHVVYHSSDGFCFSVASDQLGTMNARLISADWLTGLALLKLPAEVGTQLEQYNLEPSLELKKGEGFEVSGFPWKSDAVTTDGRCHVLNPNSTRAFIAGVPFFVEADNCHIEYGMSGGGLFSQTNQLVGIISHQLLVPQVNAPSKIVELSEEMTPDAHHFFAIPADFAAHWVRDVLLNKREAAILRDWNAVLTRQPPAVIAGHLRFEWLQGTANGGVGGSEGHGIGGSEGHGIGGSEGHGIGGQERTSNSAISVSYVANPLGTYKANVHQEWFENLKKQTLIKQSVVTVPFVVRPPTQPGLSPVPMRIDSLAEFFSLIARPDRIPFARISLPAAHQDKTGILRNMGESLEKLNQRIFGDDDKSSFQIELELLQTFLCNDSAELIDLAWVLQLRNFKRADFKQVALRDFEGSVQLLSLLELIESELRAKRIISGPQK